MSDHDEHAGPESIEFHLTDDDLPPEALKDCMRPPKVSTLVHCIHCNEEYDSWRIVYRVRVGYDGKVRGFWDCPMPGCDGAGFQFDIFPVDRNYIAEEGQPQGEWVEDHDDDCTCEDCEEMRKEIEEFEREHPIVPIAKTEDDSECEEQEASAESNDNDRRRINEAMAGLREPDDRIPLDDLLPDGPEDGTDQGDGLTPEVMMQIEQRMGLSPSSPQNVAFPPPSSQPRKPLPLPPNWRELLAKQDERDERAGGVVGEDDVPF